MRNFYFLPKQSHLILLVLLSFQLTNSNAQVAFNWAYIPTSTSLSQNQINITATDHLGNIIEVGKVTGHADMDPGTGPTDTSFTRFFYNHYLSKTSSNGHLLWIYYFEDNSQISTFDFKGLKITPTNEIIVSGNFTGKVDFDLAHSGIDTLRSHHTSFPDYFVAKYDASGNHLWALSGGNTGSGISAQALTLLPNSNILLSLNPSSITDVDPSNAVHNTIGASANLVSYNQSGNYLWNSAITPNFSYAVSYNSLDADAAGNSYLLSVGSYELTISKFTVSGAHLWTRTIGNFSTGARVNPQSVLVDKSNGNFYLAGTFDGTVDFNPNAAVLNYTCASALDPDAFIAKYDSSMNPIWINQYVGKISFGNYSLEYDGNDLVSVGNYSGTADFGGGFSFTTSSTYSPFFIRLNTSGTTLDAFTLSGIGQFSGISKGLNQDFTIIGNIMAWVDMDPTAAIYNLHGATSNFFTAVYQITAPTAIPENEKSQQNEIVIYPNPFEQEINFNFIEKENQIHVQIYDARGNKLVEQNSAEAFQLTTSDWLPGIYFARIISPKKTRNFKLIKL